MGSAYVIVYSIADRGSFESASELRIQLRRTHQADHVPIILVGNKADLARCREVSVEGEPSTLHRAPWAPLLPVCLRHMTSGQKSLGPF